MDNKRALEAHRVGKFAGPHSALAPQPATIPANSAAPPPDSLRVCIHFDVDCFYAQCEELRNPSLAALPLAVTQKFLVVTCNYRARARGVTKLMATAEALRLCPELVTVSGEDLTPYRAASKRLLEVLRRFGPAQKLGLDEVFVDVSEGVERRIHAAGGRIKGGWAGHVHTPAVMAGVEQDSRHRPMDLRARPEASMPPSAEHAYLNEAWRLRLVVGSQLAQEARRMVRAETELRASAGVACNRMLAKLISGLHKPDDQTVLLPPHATQFVAPLPVRALPGIGHKMEAELAAAGVHTVADLRRYTAAELNARFGGRAGGFLAAARWGNDATPVVETGPPKSITVEDSFKSCVGMVAARNVLQVLAPDLAARLREEEDDSGRRPSKLALKWRVRGQGWDRNSASCAFPTIHASKADAAGVAAALAAAAARLLAANLADPFEDLTLLSIGATGFTEGVPPPGQRSIAELMNGGGAGAGSATASLAPPLPPRANPAAAATAAAVSTADPAALAAASAHLRRDYGAGGAALALSKREERAMREGTAAHAAGPNGAADEPEAERGWGGGEEGINSGGEEEEEEDLWDDLAGLHGSKPLLRKRSRREPGSHTAAGAHLPALPPNHVASDASRRIIVHCDIDSFYCAVERLDDPSLNNVPLAVHQFNAGGFVAVSYEARAAGIRCGDGAGAAGRVAVPHLASMQARSIAECKAACPGLQVRPMRPERYREIGKAVHEALKLLVEPKGGQVEKASCDDFYMDVTSACSLRPTPSSSSNAAAVPLPDNLTFIQSSCGHQPHDAASWADLPADLQAGVQLAAAARALTRELGLMASCGVARNKLVARLASPVAKPDGLTVVPDTAAVAFVRSVPLHKVPSLRGQFGAEVEGTVGASTVGELLAWSRPQLEARFGEARGRFLADLVNAQHSAPVTDKGPPRTLTAERSFPPAASQDAVASALLPLADDLLRRAADVAAENRRLPAKLGVAFRLGYGTNIKSRSGPIPHQVLRWLSGGGGGGDASSTADRDEIHEAVASSALALVSGANEGRWDVTRVALVLHYSAAAAAGGGVSGRAAHVAVQTSLRDKKAPIKEKKPQQPSGTYRNPVALALQQLFSSSGGPAAAGVAQTAGDEEAAASLKLALRLQREEAEAAATTARAMSSAVNKKQKRQGPLDAFFTTVKRQK